MPRPINAVTRRQEKKSSPSSAGCLRGHRPANRLSRESGRGTAEMGGGVVMVGLKLGKRSVALSCRSLLSNVTTLLLKSCFLTCQISLKASPGHHGGQKGCTRTRGGAQVTPQPSMMHHLWDGQAPALPSSFHNACSPLQSPDRRGRAASLTVARKALCT